MATIRKTKSGQWNVQIRSGGRLIKSTTHSTRERAERWASKNEPSLKERHPLFLDTGHTYCHEVLAGKPSQALSYNRIDRISRHSCMQGTMDALTLQDINQFKQARLAEVSTTTCRDELLMIRRVFRWYIRERLAATGERMDNPCDLLSIPQARKPRDRVVSRKELSLLLSAMSPQMALVVELAYETAMRRSEILKLRPQDLHLDERFLSVIDGKEGSRDVPLTSRAVELLQAAADTNDPKAGFLFAISPYGFTQAVRRAREKVGLGSDVRLHQLRHSRISEVARKGFSQAQIMLVSGHKDSRSVQRYTHLNVRDIIGLLD